MARPKLNIKKTKADWIIECIGHIIFLCMIALPALYYMDLPDIIPTHFDIKGNPDGFGGKTSIWLLPAVGASLYSLLFILNFFPHTFNYLTEITEDNAKRINTNATRLIRLLNVSITCMFFYLTFSTIETAQGNQSGLGTYFLPVFIVLIAGITGYHFFKMRK